MRCGVQWHLVNSDVTNFGNATCNTLAVEEPGGGYVANLCTIFASFL